jgi:hypothetical protein
MRLAGVGVMLLLGVSMLVAVLAYLYGLWA